MNFHFCLSTLPIQFHESVQDTILLIAAGLLDCSCNVTIDNEQAIFGGTTINLFLEHFDYEVSGTLENSEHIDANGIFVGNHHIDIRAQIDLLYKVLNTATAYTR